MADKILNINYRINVAKWAINQPLAYPILIIIGSVIMVLGVTFNNYLLMTFLILLTVTYFYLFGVERDGVFMYSKVINYLSFKANKKTKFNRSNNVDNHVGNVTITNKLISTKLNINNVNSDNDELSKILISNVSDDYLYGINTKINDLQINDIQAYLRSNISNVDASLLPVLNSYINDIESLVKTKQFKTVSNELNISIVNIDPELEHKKTKLILNQSKQLKNQTNKNICLY